MKLMNEQERFDYLKALLTEKEWNHLLHLKYEWDDTYDSEEEMLESHFEISIPYKGFDLYENKLFVCVLYKFLLPEYSVTLNKTITFDTFEAYYDFLGGDIYSRASYYGYTFSPDDVKTFQIDTDKTITDAFEKKTLDNVRDGKDVAAHFRMFWDHTEERKRAVAELCRNFFQYSSYEDVEQKHPDLTLGDFFLAARYAIVKDTEKTLDILESVRAFLHNDLRNYILFHFRDGHIYDRYCDQSFSGFFLPNKHLLITPDTPLRVTEAGKGFDHKTNFFYKDLIFCFGEDDKYDFRKIYIDIVEMASDCDNDLSGGHFLHCHYDIDFSLYKTDGAQLPYGEITKQLHVTREGGTYRCVFRFMSGETEVTTSSYAFDTTRDFLHFMKYDVNGTDPRPIFEKLRNGEEVVIMDV